MYKYCQNIVVNSFLKVTGTTGINNIMSGVCDVVVASIQKGLKPFVGKMSFMKWLFSLFSVPIHTIFNWSICPYSDISSQTVEYLRGTTVTFQDH